MSSGYVANTTSNSDKHVDAGINGAGIGNAFNYSGSHSHGNEGTILVDSFDNSTVKDVLWPFQAKMHQLQEASTFVFKSRLLEVKHRSWWKACRMPYNCR